MEKIKIKRRISSSTLRIRELEKYINKDVEIVIYTTQIGFRFWKPILLLYADNEGNIIFENQFIVGITPISEILINEEALLSEKVLAKEWNNDEEDTARDYLQKNL